MEASGGNSDAYRSSSSSSTSSFSTTSNHSRRNGLHISASTILRSPLSTLLEYTGFLRTRSSNSESDSLLNNGANAGLRLLSNDSAPTPTASSSGSAGEVSIRIIGSAEHDHDRVGTALHSGPSTAQTESFSRPVSRSPSGASVLSSLESQVDLRSDRESVDGASNATNAGGDADGAEGVGTNNRDSSSSYQRYDIQQAARWIEQVLPFSLLLLIVFIRQHLQGFCVTIWIAAFMFKSNDIVRKQTALKGERKITTLIGIVILYSLHVFGFYWWYRNDVLYPLLMLPPRTIPPFWNVIFIIMVNDTLVRQAAMILKCMLLIYFKNSRGRNYRRQGQMLTLVEYLLLLYRALLPAPVWYRFFLNKEYGSLFSSLMTGLYLTFKLTSVVEKVQSFITALKALSRKDIHYGVYATTEQA
ncbi:uncharacterized protein LOC131019802 isoform X2 [Salvia miltiorrhiza]|uniref:uncharacterized protein LOC131019802 isoform X2 n=1 Tax=Salvia miltiorrhiza TaxID=226208 RepID=UPI0025AD14B0|nr:uncharacterized protein LOC131019802 isoform X2 [Salvia miltiorrhiza]